MAAMALLADRDPDARIVYGTYLRQFEYEVEEAEDGREALAKALALRPAVIVTETTLPGITGLELCRLLRYDPSTKATPIILVSGDGSAADVRVAEAAGADAVLIKPCPPEQLAEHIRRVLVRSSEMRTRGSSVRESVAPLEESDGSIGRAPTARRAMLSHAYQRRDTTEPPLRPPALVCPVCDGQLLYVRSHLGGVNAHLSEQWDYFDCAHGAARSNIASARGRSVGSADAAGVIDRFAPATPPMLLRGRDRRGDPARVAVFRLLVVARIRAIDLAHAPLPSRLGIS